ncbi:unnamed protein product [Dovyalis caffra]|uniref:Uncharacterized protein n=1 Tax=Dovyalis caffra TaxID=77055 RepID=A0AAV1SE91_9ROSI|nr:unnamed protein product [Dovyalis caffra]
MATSTKLSQSYLVMLLVLALCLAMAQAGRDGVNLCAGFAPPGSCIRPINCFRPDPVCGANGVTYWCGCPEAACARVKIVKLGAC